jgi:hypothetical protein
MEISTDGALHGAPENKCQCGSRTIDVYGRNESCTVSLQAIGGGGKKKTFGTFGEKKLFFFPRR